MPAPVLSEVAPISSLINYVNTLTSQALSSVAGDMITAITPFGAAAFGIYIILMMWSYMRGAEADPVQDFLVKFFSWSLIIGYGLNAATYTSVILPIVTGLGNSFLSLIGGGVSQTAMDSLAIGTIQIIQNGYEQASILSDSNGFSGLALTIGMYVLLLFKVVLLVVGVIPFLVACTVTVIVANTGSQIVGAVAPLFFLALLFPATRQYFSAWLNTALSYALIPLFVAVVAVLGMGVTIGILGIPATPSTTNTLVNVSLFRVFYAALANLTFLFLLQQVTSLASSLSSGGINAGMPSGGITGIASRGASQIRAAGKTYKAGRKMNRQRLANRRDKQNKKNGVKAG